MHSNIRRRTTQLIAAHARSRYGNVAVLTAILLVILMFCVAVGVDLGTVMLVKTQLQAASDAAALAAAAHLGSPPSEIIAEATNYAGLNKQLGGQGAEIKPSDVEVGIWDRGPRRFTPAGDGNAVRVTTRGTNHGFFFARVLGAKAFSSAASATACVVPRDIVFVVDLSGSMNEDTEPAWSPAAIDGKFGSGTSETLMNDLYFDLYGLTPGPDFDLMTFLQNNGFPVAGPEYAYAVLTMDEGLLSQHPHPKYRILVEDDEDERRNRARAWLREEVLPALMPNVDPPFSEKKYWDRYCDYIIRPMYNNVLPPEDPPEPPEEPQPPAPRDYSPCWVDPNNPNPNPSPPEPEPDENPSQPPEPPTPPLPPSPPPFDPGPISRFESSPGGRHVGLSGPQPSSGWTSEASPLVPVSTLVPGLAFSGLVLGSGYYDEECVSRVDYQYNRDYGEYLDEHRDWQNVLMPQWQQSLEDYHDTYLPAYAADARSRGGPPLWRGNIPRFQPLNEYGRVDRIANVGEDSYSFNNPNPDITSLSASVPVASTNQFGYRTYAQFQLDFGRNLIPGATTGQKVHVPLSLSSPYCRLHSESVGDAETGYSDFRFPPREQPMHAARRSLIRAIKVLESRNQGLPKGLKDNVAIVTFDGHHPELKMQPQIVCGLTDDYPTAMQACTTLQATGDKLATTAIESGMITAMRHLTDRGRTFSKKVVVVLTDGVPNQVQTAESEVDAYISGVLGADAQQFYDSDPLSWPKSRYWFNGPLMQAHIMRQRGWDVFAVGLGFGADADFMDRVAVLGGTADVGQGLQAGGNPTQYEENLTKIFKKIIFTPTVRLVD